MPRCGRTASSVPNISSFVASGYDRKALEESRQLAAVRTELLRQLVDEVCQLEGSLAKIHRIRSYSILNDVLQLTVSWMRMTRLLGQERRNGF